MSLPDLPADPSAVTDFRALFESAPDLLVVLDASDQYRIVAASDTYLRSIRAERATFVGH